MLTTKNLPKIILSALFAVVIILGFLLFIVPPSVFPDPANGFRVMHDMEIGGGFNRLISPDQSDITKNTSDFLTWWSPGQYLVPYAFKLLFGVNTGQASALTITLCQLLGLAGFYSFFRKVGFSTLISALSILFIACQQFFVVPYVFYNGGESLFFAFAGWFLLGLTAFKNTGWQLALFILIMGWIGFFCKSSILWMYAAGLLYLWIKFSSGKKTTGWIKNGLWIGVPAAISLAAIWLFFLSKGQNPASVSTGLKLGWKTFGFPLASPVLSGFSIDDLAHGLVFHTGKVMFSDTQAILIIVATAALSLWLFIRILKNVPDADYRLLLQVFYIAAILFFSYAYLRQMLISYEARHFRIVGLIFIPGVIYLVSKIKPAYQAAFSMVWIGITIASILYVTKGYTYNKDKSAHGVSGIAQQAIDQKALNEIITLDNTNTHATFVFVNESLGLEVKHNRVINQQPIGDNLKIDMDDYEYDGHNGPLYVILPESYAGPKEKMILKSFPDYKGWYGSMLSNGYVMYAAK